MASEKLPYDGGCYGRERCEQGKLPRHRHSFGYMCVVLKGRFLEAGDAGRFRVQPGDVLVHGPFEAHLDLFDGSGAEVLNLPLADAGQHSGRFRIDDPDAIAALAERDPASAARAVALRWTAAPGEADWPDLLAEALCESGVSIGRWAERQGLAPATVSRGFRQAYGTTPARFRAELRARRAWAKLGTTDRPLVDVALASGFADQAHMTRSVRRLTGGPPTRWRHQVKSVQDRP
jgi:AraC-like DNA-binding protein